MSKAAEKDPNMTAEVTIHRTLRSVSVDLLFLIHTKLTRAHVNEEKETAARENVRSVWWY